MHNKFILILLTRILKVTERLNKPKEGKFGKLTSEKIINMSRKDVGDIGGKGITEDLLQEVMFESCMINEFSR